MNHQSAQTITAACLLAAIIAAGCKPNATDAPMLKKTVILVPPGESLKLACVEFENQSERVSINAPSNEPVYVFLTQVRVPKDPRSNQASAPQIEASLHAQLDTPVAQDVELTKTTTQITTIGSDNKTSSYWAFNYCFAFRPRAEKPRYLKLNADIFECETISHTNLPSSLSSLVSKNRIEIP